MKIFTEDYPSGVEIKDEDLYRRIKSGATTFTGMYEATSFRECDLTNETNIMMPCIFKDKVGGEEYRIAAEIGDAIANNLYWDDAPEVEKAKEPEPLKEEKQEEAKSTEEAQDEEKKAKKGGRKGKGSSKRKKTDIYQGTTDMIVKMLEEGTTPWQRSWDQSLSAQIVGSPQNYFSHYTYNDYNQMHLAFYMASRGLTDPRFMTFGHMEAENNKNREYVEECKAKGKKYDPRKEWKYHLKKGSHGTLVRMTKIQDKDREGNLLPREDRFFMQRYVHLHNAEDFVLREYKRDKDGKYLKDEKGKLLYEDHPLPAFVPKKGYTHEEQSEICEAILKASGAKIVNDVPFKHQNPCYVHNDESIHLPPKEAFKDLNDYYAVALHELAHWTGSEKRMKRTFGWNKQDPDYAKEELRAELASVYLSQDLGIPVSMTNHAAYVGSWIQMLKNDKDEISRAQKDAIAITRYIKKFIPERFREKGEALEEAPEGVQVDVEEKGVVVDVEDTPQQKPEASQEDEKAKEAKEEKMEEQKAKEEGAKTEEAKQPELEDPARLYKVDDPALKKLSDKALATETAAYYRYFSKKAAIPPNIPTENYVYSEHHPTDCPFEKGNAVYYAKQLSASEAAKYNLTPDYRYFANKSVHVEVFRKKGDAPQEEPYFFGAHYDKIFEGNYVRKKEDAPQIICGKVGWNAQQGRLDGLDSIKAGDLLEVDGQMWQAQVKGFERMQLTPYEKDVVLTPLPLEQVKQMIAEAEKTVENKESYAVYRQKFRENAYIGSLSDDTLAMHPGAFRPTDLVDDTVKIEMQAAYAENFRRNTMREGLSIYTPSDERGWKNFDVAAAQRMAMKLYGSEEYETEHMIEALKKSDPATIIGNMIQENSPASVLTQDEEYGVLCAIEGLKKGGKTLDEVFKAWTAKHNPKEEKQQQEDKGSSKAAEAEEREEEGRGR